MRLVVEAMARLDVGIGDEIRRAVAVRLQPSLAPPKRPPDVLDRGDVDMGDRGAARPLRWRGLAMNIADCSWTIEARTYSNVRPLLSPASAERLRRLGRGRAVSREAAPYPTR
jgi:hypothetical protein